MITLSMGFQEPQNGDTGDIFYPALAANLVQLNNHNHDGVSSQLLTTTTQNIAAGSWSAAPAGGGLYVQTVTLPTSPVGLSYDVVQIWFKLSTGELVYPTIERVSTTQYKIYTIDNTLNYIANYR